MTQLKPGDRLRSRVCTTEVIIVKVGGGEAALACGGHPMANGAESAGGPQMSLAGEASAGSQGTLLGKRYADDGLGLELLCVKGGSGELTVNGRPLLLMQARPLPASD